MVMYLYLIRTARPGRSAHVKKANLLTTTDLQTQHLAREKAGAHQTVDSILQYQVCQLIALIADHKQMTDLESNGNKVLVCFHL